MAEYIEREAALNICQKEYEERLEMCDYCGDTVAWNIGGQIKKLPAADVAEVNHGKWEWFEEKHGTPIDGYDYDWGWHCSNCKAELSDDYDDPDTPPKMRYCPHCGAKMDLEG